MPWAERLVIAGRTGIWLRRVLRPSPEDVRAELFLGVADLDLPHVAVESSDCFVNCLPVHWFQAEGAAHAEIPGQRTVPFVVGVTLSRLPHVDNFPVVTPGKWGDVGSPIDDI